MPRQENEKRTAKKKDMMVTFEREAVNGDAFDVVRIDGVEIVAFHVTNIDTLALEHNEFSMLKVITDYFTNS